MDAKNLAELLADDLVGAGLIGEGSKGQYIRWMLGKVRGDRKDKHYRQPLAKDTKRKPVYAGWTPDDWDGKYKPFDPKLVKNKRSKFIQALVKEELKPRPIHSISQPQQKLMREFLEDHDQEKLKQMTFTTLAFVLSELNGKPPVKHAQSKAVLITRINKELAKRN